MRVNLTSALRQAVPVFGLLLLASATVLPANAQYGPSYYPQAPAYNNNNQTWNNASYWVAQNNPNNPARSGYYRNTGPGSTDFGYATIPQAVNPDATAIAYDDTKDGQMYVYNFTGGAGPVYDNSFYGEDLHCFPC